jgi:hypothetical protein
MINSTHVRLRGQRLRLSAIGSRTKALRGWLPPMEARIRGQIK